MDIHTIDSLLIPYGVPSYGRAGIIVVRQVHHKSRRHRFGLCSESLGGDVGLAIIDKRRPEPNVSAVMHIIGDVQDKTCVIVDDLADTAGTLCHAAKALKDHGAKRVIAYATHPVFSGPAISNIENSELDEVVVTNTIPLSESGAKCTKIRQLSVASILSETISRVHVGESVSDLFSHVVDD